MEPVWIKIGVVVLYLITGWLFAEYAFIILLWTNVILIPVNLISYLYIGFVLGDWFSFENSGFAFLTLLIGFSLFILVFHRLLRYFSSRLPSRWNNQKSQIINLEAVVYAATYCFWITFFGLVIRQIWELLHRSR